MNNTFVSEQSGLDGPRSGVDSVGAAGPTRDALPPSVPLDAISPEMLMSSLYKSILNRNPDPGGLRQYLDFIRDGMTVESLVSQILKSVEYANLVVRNPIFVNAAIKSPDFVRRFTSKLGLVPRQSSNLFPEEYVGNAEAGKFYKAYRQSGFFESYMSGEKVLDIGYKGYDNPKLLTIVPHAIGVDLDYPGYDGARLPFDDGTIDAVYSSHCLEHISNYKATIRDWYRVVKVGGFVVCAVPSQLLYEKKRAIPSRYNADHKRFYSPLSLIAEFGEALEENSYRVRFLEENDKNYTYDVGPERHAGGCYEIIIVIEKIEKPAWSIG
ncbi:MAG: methyltransferase domain-containing protein [Bradyrhizobium sp.]|nr:methyltransferase domain-containing protein [Bradyrhizobium sp.]